MSDVSSMLSLAYRKQIDEACSTLPVLGLKHFVMSIAFNDGSTFVLSNLSPVLAKELGGAQSNEQRYYLDGELSGPLLTKTALLKPNYSITRAHAECTFAFNALGDESAHDEPVLDAKAIKRFEDFCIHFVDTFLDLIVSCNPAYRFSFILTNKSLRDAVIRQGYEEHITLSVREQECLLLAGQGNTSKVIAKKLNISPHTVEDYLKHIRKVLHCDSIAHAMYECIQRGIIGKVSFVTSTSS